MPDMNDYLIHYGINGMKWGIRRFQNKDGSLTEAGKKRYGSSSDEVGEKLEKAKLTAQEFRAKYAKKKSRLLFATDIGIHRAEKKWAKAEKEVSKLQKIHDNLKKKEDSDRAEKEAGEQKAFDEFKETLKEKDGMTKLLQGDFLNGKLDKTLEYVDKKESKLINEWNKKKAKNEWGNDSEAFSADARKYVKQAAKDLGLPLKEETYSFLLDWFFNGDD